MLKLTVICRGNWNSLEYLVEHWKEKYSITQSLLTDVIWVEWANEQCVEVTNNTARKNVIVRINGSEYYQKFWEKCGPGLYKMISMNPAYEMPLPIEYIPDFIDMDFWKPVTVPQDLTLLMVGNFTYCKAQLGLLRLVAERPRFFKRVLMVGKFQPDRVSPRIEAEKIIVQLRYFAKKHGINLELMDHQPREKLVEIYNSAALVVSNSTNEGCHAVVQEAMSCGTRVLVRDWMGADGIFPREAIFTTATRFWKLVDNPPSVDYREYVRENFAKEAIWPRLDKIIEEAAQQ